MSGSDLCENVTNVGNLLKDNGSNGDKQADGKKKKKKKKQRAKLRTPIAVSTTVASSSKKKVSGHSVQRDKEDTVANEIGAAFKELHAHTDELMKKKRFQDRMAQ